MNKIKYIVTMGNGVMILLLDVLAIIFCTLTISTIIFFFQGKALTATNCVATTVTVPANKTVTPTATTTNGNLLVPSADSDDPSASWSVFIQSYKQELAETKSKLTD
jgi:hypothetical protein